MVKIDCFLVKLILRLNTSCYSSATSPQAVNNRPTFDVVTHARSPKLHHQSCHVLALPPPVLLSPFLEADSELEPGTTRPPPNALFPCFWDDNNAAAIVSASEGWGSHGCWFWASMNNNDSADRSYNPPTAVAHHRTPNPPAFLLCIPKSPTESHVRVVVVANSTGTHVDRQWALHTTTSSPSPFRPTQTKMGTWAVRPIKSPVRQ